MSTAEIIEKIEKIERELEELKKAVKAQAKPIDLAGIWKGVEVTEEDIEAAKKSLFKNLFDPDFQQ